MTQAQPEQKRGPPEGSVNRGCWLTGVFLVFLFATPCVVPVLYFWSGSDERAAALNQARETGDAHCMALWDLVRQYLREEDALPQSLDDLEQVPEKPAFIHAVHGNVYGQGRYFRIEYSFDDPSTIFGTTVIRRTWTNKRGRWIEARDD